MSANFNPSYITNMRTRNVGQPVGLPLLPIALGVILAVLPIQAGTKNSTPAPAMTKREAERAKADKLHDDENRAVAVHLSYLKTYLPKVTAAEIKGASITNLRRLYYEAYRVQGLTSDEATRKATDEITSGVAGGGKATKNGGWENRDEQARFEFLQSYLPTLTASDVKGRNPEDLRNLYYEAYRKQGMTMAEARKQAEELDLGPAANKMPAKAASAASPTEPERIDSNLAYLQGYLPKLTAADLVGKSDADLKHLYYQAYLVQGMRVQEAKLTADRLVVIKLTSEADADSLLPGQIASSSKPGARKMPAVDAETKK